MQFWFDNEKIYLHSSRALLAERRWRETDKVFENDDVTIGAHSQTLRHYFHERILIKITNKKHKTRTLAFPIHFYRV